MPGEKIINKIICPYCNHNWVTSSKYIMVSCPSCLKKIKNVQVKKLTEQEILENGKR